jgi:hypothetical protein
MTIMEIIQEKQGVLENDMYKDLEKTASKAKEHEPC